MPLVTLLPLHETNDNRDYHLTLGQDGRVDVSYRLTIALSLLHLPISDDEEHSSTSGSTARGRKYGSNFGGQERSADKTTNDRGDHGGHGDSTSWSTPFLDLVSGMVDHISDENDRRVQSTIRQLCFDILTDGVNATRSISELQLALSTVAKPESQATDEVLAGESQLAHFVAEVWQSDTWCARAWLDTEQRQTQQE